MCLQMLKRDSWLIVQELTSPWSTGINGRKQFIFVEVDGSTFLDRMPTIVTFWGRIASSRNRHWVGKNNIVEIRCCLSEI
mmetsp:Transcript_40949/g.60137  ORF Transcript_40949/g.60137 Transcript_40949/m.60137 type:complete len:80 (-) Transcript_40949:32-271(-)